MKAKHYSSVHKVGRGFGLVKANPLFLYAGLMLSLAANGWAYEPVGPDGRPCHITRGIYCHAQPLLTASFWQRYAGEYAFNTEAAHSGRFSLKVVNATGAEPGSGVVQTVRLNQTQPAPIKLAGWSKAVNVAEEIADWRYAIYVDFVYADGTPLHMQIVAFSGGTHDWQYAETIVQPEKPLASARVYVFLRRRSGLAYFDDLFLGPPNGPNLLKNAGFEPEDREDRAARDAIYRTYQQLHANAIHTYLSGDPAFWHGEEGKGNADVRAFLAEAKAHNIGVWLTTGEPPLPAIKDARDPNFPQYLCVNGPWGAAWTETLRLAAGYDFAGISVVPDEYNWTNAPLRERYSKHPDPQVAAFYQQLPAMCNCPNCAALYKNKYGQPLPPLALGMEFPEATLPYLQYLQFRYESTTRWIARSAAAIKSGNPRIRADSLICVHPICSDFWWISGVAWDQLGTIRDFDFPTTDPYILLHNYLGDSTHWYVTETATHLTGATPKRHCGIVLEGSRLRPDHRELDPVEIYGSALSAVAHGATELAYWHYSHLTDESKTTEQAALSRACIAGVYALLERADPWLGGLHAPPLVAYLHSRASDDLWRFYAPRGPEDQPQNNPRYAAVAQKEILYYLFRRGVPVELYYLESVQEAQLRPYRVIIVPFPYAISDAQAALLERLAAAGKTIIVVSQLGPLDEIGQRRAKPALAALCGLSAPPADPAAQHIQRRGRGRIIFLGEAYGYGLPLHRNNQKRTRTERILPDPLNPDRVAVWDTILKEACDGEPWALASLSSLDFEARMTLNAAGEPVLLAINWEDQPTTVELRAWGTKRTRWTGFRLARDGRLVASSVQGQLAGGHVRFRLRFGPQEAGLWHAP